MEELNALPLSDISAEQLDELTNLLWMDPGVRITMPDHEWLLDQQARISRLHKSNRRSMKIRDRLSARLESLTLQHVDDGMPSACLCPFHHDLNRKLIRRLMLLIVSECTERIQLLRTWRARIAFPKTVIAWLDRIDAVSGLWFGRDAFNATFGYDRASPTDLIVRSKCEACIMSVIGGRPQVLADLRANLILRRDRHIDRGRSGPRLLRLIESWTGQFDADCRRVILTGIVVERERMKKAIDMVVAITSGPPVSNIPDRAMGLRPAMGTNIRTSAGARAIKPRRVKVAIKAGWKNMKIVRHLSGWIVRCSDKASQPNSGERFSNKICIPPSVTMHRMLQKSHRAPASGGQRAVPERHADSVSTFSNKSAVPLPLSLTRQTQQMPSPPRSTYSSSAVGTVWEPVSVFSPPATVIEDLPSRLGPAAPNSDNTEDPNTSTFADNRAHLEFCERYGLPTTVETETGGSGTPRPTHTTTQRAEDNGSTVTASSIYSAYPGFRRSQERLVVAEERKWAGGQSKASSSRSSHAPTLRQDSSLLAMVRNNRNKMLEEDEDE
ncbi:hypothetical protein FHETE_7981 [Fusarium heterosporum]|uniref:Uncharacterized protein n=1 Tax=Fusarium heterosporum TaxID=42747 RepID=A0A8H5T0F2_FUSHE|nr:hypothetical protein FHETE_7981 [Fusarium heterosporum]